MFLDVTQRRNPQLVDFSVWLHRHGQIRANTYVLDADGIVSNALLTAQAGRREGIALLVMTKQYGRNPYVSQLIRDAGLARFVAVDVDEARVLWRAGLDVAHVGHLVACSSSDVETVVAHAPRWITVYNVEQAERIALASAKRGAEIDLLLRLYDPSLDYYPGQHGGFLVSQLDEALDAITRFSGVRPAGVTAHPCLYYDYETGEGGATPKLELLRLAAAKVKARGTLTPEINAPGVSCVATLPLLAAEGVTTAEPGSSLTGSTPLHAFSEQPECPAVTYVTEVAHMIGSSVYTFGGGFYPRGHVRGALVFSSVRADPIRLSSVELPASAIDYYGELRNELAASICVGDTAVYAFRNQIFVSRSQVAVVEGLQASPPRPRLIAIYDSRGALLEEC